MFGQYIGMCQKNRCDCSAIESTGAELIGGVLRISVQPLRAYRDYKYYALDICLALPALTGTEPVAIYDGAASYALMDTNGQPVVSGRLRGHRRYRVRFGSGGVAATGTIPAHFTVYEGLCPMEYSANPALQAPTV